VIGDLGRNEITGQLDGWSLRGHYCQSQGRSTMKQRRTRSSAVVQQELGPSIFLSVDGPLDRSWIFLPWRLDRVGNGKLPPSKWDRCICWGLTIHGDGDAEGAKRLSLDRLDGSRVAEGRRSWWRMMCVWEGGRSGTQGDRSWLRSWTIVKSAKT